MKNQLAGRRILVTRPREQSSSLTGLLADRGAVVVELPLIRIGPPASWEPFDACFTTNTSIYDWVLFASVNAVEATISRLQHLEKLERLRLSKLAAIGPATEAALRGAGYRVDFCPRSFIAESFVEEFPGNRSSLASAKMLWPKTDIGRTLISDRLRDQGASVDIVYCYSTQGPENPALCASQLGRMLLSGQLDVITLTSSETVRNFYKLLLAYTEEANIPVEALLQNVKLAVIGPETARTTKSLMGRVDIQAGQYTIAGLVAAIEKQTTI